ncbi:unnamed protein product [Lactuca saligna]|uniref:Uncharacterized protein n=1 Tax=Lactuca saligna TaxID=75948 RepID=A0AA35Z3F0_LACSI|nr:unnamed protein product [Lactuca saligna]
MVSHPYPEEDQVVPRTPEEESDYNSRMYLPPILVSTDEEPFEYEEKSSEDEEHPVDEIGGVHANSSPYPDSTSNQDREETQEEDPTESDSSP